MKTDNVVKIFLESFEGIHAICTSDCGLGQLYHFACALASFTADKIQAVEKAQKDAMERAQQTVPSADAQPNSSDSK